MKVTIEAMQSTETWRFKQSSDLHLRIYANETFQTSDGERWYAGSPFGQSRQFLPIPLTLNGAKLVYPDIEIDSTEDSPDVADPRYSSYVFAGKKRLFPHVLGFAVPVSLNVVTWEHLIQHRDALRGPRLEPGVYDVGVVENLISRYLGDRAVATINSIGMAMGSAPSVDPMNPIHVSQTDPLWTALSQGQGLSVARGQAELVPNVNGARAIVETPLVSMASVIAPFSQSNGVLGTLRAPVENVVDGVSFEIVSSNPVDEGTVGWLLY